MNSKDDFARVRLTELEIWYNRSEKRRQLANAILAMSADQLELIPDDVFESIGSTRVYFSKDSSMSFKGGV